MAWARRVRRYARLLALFGVRELSTVPSPENQLLARSTLEAFGQLKPEQRALLILVTLEGLSYQQVSEALEIPLGTVMSRLSRARQALRTLGEGEIRSTTLRILNCCRCSTRHWSCTPLSMAN